MKKKVLLTGANGFVGGHVLDYLKVNTNWDITLPKSDLRVKLHGNTKYDYIINLASMASVEESIKEPATFIDNNVKLITNLLEYAREHKPEIFLHMSTVEVYNVTNPYAASKAAQEEICNAYWKSYDIPIVIMRATNIIGARQKDKSMFLPRIIDQIKNDEVVKIYTANGEIGARRYNPVDNVASAILFLLEQYPMRYSKAVPDAFPTHWDIEGLELTDNLTMAKKITKLLGKELLYELYEPNTDRPAYTKYFGSSGSSLHDYGWEPPVTLDEGLAWVK